MNNTLVLSRSRNIELDTGESTTLLVENRIDQLEVVVDQSRVDGVDWQKVVRVIRKNAVAIRRQYQVCSVILVLP